jgi:hypothetical protein
VHERLAYGSRGAVTIRRVLLAAALRLAPWLGKLNEGDCDSETLA